MTAIPCVEVNCTYRQELETGYKNSTLLYHQILNHVAVDRWYKSRMSICFSESVLID